MSDELKPCPFCGGNADLIREPKQVLIWCLSCDAEICYQQGEIERDRLAETIAAWNRRGHVGWCSSCDKLVDANKYDKKGRHICPHCGDYLEFADEESEDAP